MSKTVLEFLKVNLQVLLTTAEHKVVKMYEPKCGSGVLPVVDPGGQIRPWPPSKLAMEFGPPFRSRKSNDSIVNLSKSKDFGPPYRCRLRIWPPLWKKTILKHGKG